MRASPAARAGLKREPIEYFRMLYGDTALNGSSPATACGHAFFGSEASLFATDAPFDANGGRDLISGTIDAVDSLAVSDHDRARIFGGNTRALLGLT